MFKIGLIGSDSSHADRFSEIINVKDHPNYLPDTGAAITAIWGEDAERTQQVAQIGQIETIVPEPTALLGQVDAVFCVTRHGGNHLELVRPYIEAGVPTFVDKPLTVDPQEAETLLALAQKHNTLLTSCSTVRFATHVVEYHRSLAEIGDIRAAVYSGPATLRNPYGGVIFYAIHCIELMHMIQGVGVQWVEAAEGPLIKGKDNGNISAFCTWANGATANLLLTVDAQYGFRTMTAGTEGFRCSTLDNSNGYQEGLKRILAYLRGGEEPVPAEQMLASIQVAHAIQRSLEENTRIAL